MTNDKKRIVSLRVSVSDLERVKSIARRLHTRESKVFRYAIKSALAKLAPLHDAELCGRALMPVFIEYGPELTSYFDLDSTRLETVINGGVIDTEAWVPAEDIELLALSGMPERYIYNRVRELTRKPLRPMGVSASLREYLSDKYINDGETEDEGPSEARAVPASR